MRRLRQSALENSCVSCSLRWASRRDTRTVPRQVHTKQPYPFPEAANRGTYRRTRILGNDQTTSRDERGSTTHRGNGVGGRQRCGSALWARYPFRGTRGDSVGGKTNREVVRRASISTLTAPETGAPMPRVHFLTFAVSRICASHLLQTVLRGFPLKKYRLHFLHCSRWIVMASSLLAFERRSMRLEIASVARPAMLGV